MYKFNNKRYLIEENEEDEEQELFPLPMAEKCDEVGMHPSEFK